MSAWKCSDGHIQFVAEILKHNPITDNDKDISLGELILTLDFFNQLSLNRRYNEPIEIKPITLIEIDPTWHDSAVEKAQALACYNYQTCETNAYNYSSFAEWINKIAERYTKQTFTSDNGTGHWGIETEELTQPRKAMQH